MTRTNQTEDKPTRRNVSTPQSESMEAAARVHAYLEAPIPDFIRDAIVDAIAEAAERTGAPMPDIHPKHGYDLKALAYLF